MKSRTRFEFNNRLGLLLITAISTATAISLRAHDPTFSVSIEAFDRIQSEIYREYAPAVVGLKCRAAMQGRKGTFYGTGTVVAPNGIVLTSTTVVPADAEAIKVYFTNGRIMSAEVLAASRDCECILLKLSEPNLELVHMRLADSSTYRIGDPVFSWGNPIFTIEQDGAASMGRGTLSGKYNVSSVDDQSRYMGPAFETDAPVNPGSDGGPLTDIHGNIIGMITLAFSPTRWLGLAIPVDEIVRKLPALQNRELVERPEFTPAQRLAWSRELQLQAGAQQIADAIVGIWTVWPGEKDRAPQNRKQEILAVRDPYPRSDGTDSARSYLERRRPPFAQSSGIIVDPDGIVITSAFNIERTHDGRSQRASRIYAYLSDGTRFAARLLGRSTGYDLAVLKLESDNRKFPAAKLASAPVWIQGMSIAALGRSEAPGEITMNTGVVSAVNRMRGLCVQMSAMTNYGNLGGPVIDLRGRLIGMVAQLSEESMWRQNCGVGFCLRAERILEALPHLTAGRPLQAPPIPYLGIQMVSSIAESGGIQIAEVLSGSPAAKAGLRREDIMLSWDGRRINDPISLQNMILSAEIGDKAKMEIVRGDKKLELTVTIGTRSDNN